MAGDYILEGSSEPSRFDKILKMFIILAGLCLGGELVWLFVISPFRRFSRIDISGYDGIAREEILAIAALGETSSFFTTDIRTIENALMGISSLASAKVFKSFPGRLRIVLEPRRPLAYSLAALNGTTVPVLFDSEGVIFEVGGKALLGMLPIISGLVIEGPIPGTRLPPVLVPFLRELEKIENSSPELLSAVSEFRILRKPFDGIDLIMYPVHKKIKVRLSEVNEDILRYALLMVDVLSSGDDSTTVIDTLDFRSGIASYNNNSLYDNSPIPIPKEASSEQ